MNSSDLPMVSLRFMNKMKIWRFIHLFFAFRFDMFSSPRRESLEVQKVG